MSQRQPTTQKYNHVTTEANSAENSSSCLSECRFCDIVSGDEPVGETNPSVEGFAVPLHTEQFAVFPDAAPIGPRHTLVVPQAHRLSFARLTPTDQSRAVALTDRLTDSLTSCDDHEPVVFEHGSCETTEIDSVGCSITHAHLHLLLLPSGTVSDFPHREEFDQHSGLTTAWDSLDRTDYYLYGYPAGSVWATPVAEDPALACSMFLRKQFAAAIDRPDLADYRRYQGQATDDMLPEVERTRRELLTVDNRDL
jgi:diadenosine tetraphosphate (Ap4A) HIT family hydrolase